MKLRFVIVDLEIAPHIKRRLVRAGIAAGVLTFGVVAFAATPLHTWSNGDTLQATDLNGNFANLQSQILSPSFFYAQQTGGVGVASGTGVPFNFPTLAAGFANAGGTAFTIPATGVYVVDFMFMESGGGPSPTLVEGTINGTAMPALLFQFNPPTGAVDAPTTGHFVYQFTAGDSLSLTNGGATMFFYGIHSAANATMPTSTISIVRIQ